MKEIISKCPKCNGTGMADSSGAHPWGEPILIECDCVIEEAMTDMRKEFESWLEYIHGLYGEDVEWQPERNCYAKFGIHLAWCAWQASRKSITVDLSKMHLLLCDQNDVVSELNKHGLKVKV